MSSSSLRPSKTGRTCSTMALISCMFFLTFILCVIYLSNIYSNIVMRGFSNIGNTCYFNTALQCLLHIPILSNYLIRNPYKGDCEFTQIYNELTHIYWTKGEEMINVETILKAFQKKFPSDLNLINKMTFKRLSYV